MCHCAPSSFLPADRRSRWTEYSGHRPGVGRVDDRGRSACGGRTRAARHSHRPDRGAAGQLRGPGIPPDDALVPALCEEVRTPPVAGPRNPAVSSAHDRAVGSINDTHHIAAALGDEVDGVAFVLVVRNECGRIRNRLRFELPDHCRQPRGGGVCGVGRGRIAAAPGGQDNYQKDLFEHSRHGATPGQQDNATRTLGNSDEAGLLNS